MVAYHYTDKVGFANIMAPQRQKVSIWAAVLDESNPVDCGFGDGGYTTAIEPACVSSKDDILNNNYANEELRVFHLPAFQGLLVCNRKRFAIPAEAPCS